MSDATGLQSFGEESIYGFSRVGSFGRFRTGESFPIDFVMTTFSPVELEDTLTLARDIQGPNIDFHLLMQRDIDEDRVRNDVEPYLNRSQRPVPEQREIVFFPPLLAAIVPVKSDKMLDYYSREDVLPPDGARGLVVREWAPFFQLRYFPSNAPDAFMVGSTTELHGVNRHQVELRLRIAKGDDRGIKLVVIDGQHRLLALRRVYKASRAQLKDLLVPVCIVFPPKCTEDVARKSLPVVVPPVPEVFRRLFVDVNETMQTVGGHFVILLNDKTVPSLAVRKYADNVLKVDGKEGLASVEWNNRSRKTSEEITRPYALTSVGLLNKALTTLFKKQDARLFYALNLAEVDAELHPEGQDEQEYPRNIQWDSFSISQKHVIESQISRYLVPGIRRIFADVEAYAEKTRVLRELLAKQQLIANDATPGSDAARDAKKVLKNIVDYAPIADTDDDALHARTDFDRSIDLAKGSRCAPIIDYALFQRAVIDVWGTLIDQAREVEVPLKNSVDVLVYLLNRALKDRGESFRFRASYMQHSVFVGSRIRPREDTRHALAWFVLAHLGNPSAAAAAADLLVAGSQHSPSVVGAQLRESGIDSASNFGRHFRDESSRTFAKSYMVNMAIDIERRRQLEAADKQQQKEEAEYKAGQRRMEDVTTAFSQMVAQEVMKDVDLAMQDVKACLGLEVDVLVRDEEGTKEDDQA